MHDPDKPPDAEVPAAQPPSWDELAIPDIVPALTDAGDSDVDFGALPDAVDDPGNSALLSVLEMETQGEQAAELPPEPPALSPVSDPDIRTGSDVELREVEAWVRSQDGPPPAPETPPTTTIESSSDEEVVDLDALPTGQESGVESFLLSARALEADNSFATDLLLSSEELSASLMSMELPDELIDVPDLPELPALAEYPESADAPLAALLEAPLDAPTDELPPLLVSAEDRTTAAETGDETKPYSYGFVARSTRSKPILDASVTHTLPVGMRFLEATPRAELRGDSLVWRLGRLDPGAERRFRVKVMPVAGAEPAASAAVFQYSYSFSTPLARPKLALSVNAPAELLLGDTASVTARVVNSGRAPAEGIVLTFGLTSGLQSVNQTVDPMLKDRLTFDLGTLPAAGVRSIPVGVTGRDLGRQVCWVAAIAADGTSVQAETELTVTRAQLRLGLVGPTLLQFDTPAAFHLELANPGSAAARQIAVSLHLPDGVELVGASAGGAFDPEARSVTWLVTALPAGQTDTLTCSVLVGVPGALPYRATARAVLPGETLEASAEIKCSCAPPAGMPSKVLEEALAELTGPLTPTDGRSERSRLAVAGRLSQGSSASLGRRAEQYAVFLLAGSEFAAPIRQLKEIGVLVPVTPVPTAPAWIQGVANIRGDIVSIVSLRTFLGLDGLVAHANGADPLTPGNLLVARVPGSDDAVGLVVDQLRGIRAVRPDSIRPPAVALDARLAPYLLGVGEINERLVVFLDLERVVRASALLDSPGDSPAETGRVSAYDPVLSS